MFLKVNIQKPDGSVGPVIVNMEYIQDIAPMPGGIVGRTRATVANTGMQLGYECLMSMQEWDKALLSDTRVLSLS